MPSPPARRPWRRSPDFAAAERGLAAVWHDFHRSNFAQELTLVSLDLAEAYLAQGKARHAGRLLGAFHRHLGQLRMHPEGMAAWRLLIGAAACDTSAAVQALTRQAALYYRRAWRRPLPFTPKIP